MIARAGNALAAAVAHHFMGDAVAGELVDPPRMRLVAEIGEDDDVGDLADPAERLDRAGDQRLAVHFAAEEMVEQRPDAFLGDRLAARLVGHRPAEAAAFEGEGDAVRLAQPGVEMRHHVEQHFVAIGDRAAGRFIASSSSRAATSCAGLDADRLGDRDQVGLMAFEEGERRAEQAAVAGKRAVAKLVDVQPGEVKEPLRAPFVCQRRGERGERQRLGVICRRGQHRLSAIIR